MSHDRPFERNTMYGALPCSTTGPERGPASTSHGGMAKSSAVEYAGKGRGLDIVLGLDDRGRGVCIAVQDSIRAAIRDGRLRSGDPMPSSRALAADLGVARGTVVEAYEQLVTEGWLITRPCYGTWVADLPIAESPPKDPRPKRTYRHDLRPGHADPSSFPRLEWLATLRAVLTDAPDEALGYADLPGRTELRVALAGYLGRARGVRVAPDHLLVCTGAGHGMALALRALAARGARRIAVEDPSEPRLREIATAADLRLVRLPCDQGGARVDVIPQLNVDAVLVTPAHQYPLGVTLAADRRGDLLAWARASDAMIIEDDYDGELRYDRRPVGALQALDPTRVIYAGTTSKSLSAALRVGWLAVPESLVDALVRTARTISAFPSSFEQLAFARYIEKGLFDRHIRRMRGIYRQRRDTLIDGITARALPVRVTGIAAGGHAVIRLPAGGPSERQVIEGAAAHDLAVAGLEDYAFGNEGISSNEHGPALVIGYGTPAGRSYRGAVNALMEYLAGIYVS